MWKYSFVAGCRRLDCGDPRLSWPADQLHRHPFHPERDTARSFLSLDHIWAQHSEVSKHQFPSDSSETKFFLLCPVTETTLSKVQKSSLLLAYEVNAVGPILVIKVKLTGSLLFLFPVVMVSTFCILITTSPLTLRVWIDSFGVSTWGHYWRLEVAPRPVEDSHWLQTWVLESVP